MLFGSDNLTIYNFCREVPQNAQKPFSNGSFSGTDINPMWRIKKLTEVFGPCGIGWYYEVLSERAETYGDTVMAIVDLNLYVKDAEGNWSKPIFGTGGNLLVQVTKSGARPSDEGYKKALTDALSIACKALGIGADIWYSKDVNNDPQSKYADRYIEVGGTPAQPAPPMQKLDRAAPAKVITGEPIDMTCENCGNPIQDALNRAGEPWFASDIAAFTKKRFGKALCCQCAKEAKKGA